MKMKTKLEELCELSNKFINLDRTEVKIKKILKEMKPYDFKVVMRDENYIDLVIQEKEDSNFRYIPINRKRI